MNGAIRYEHSVEHVLAVTHPPVPMGDEEWDSFLDVLRETVESHGKAGVIVAARGKGGPDVNQRARLSHLASQFEGIRMAVLTDSAFLRGTVTALRWLATFDVQAFALEDEGKAADFLRLSREETVQTLAVLHSLRAQDPH